MGRRVIIHLQSQRDDRHRDRGAAGGPGHDQRIHLAQQRGIHGRGVHGRHQRRNPRGCRCLRWRRGGHRSRPRHGTARGDRPARCHGGARPRSGRQAVLRRTVVQQQAADRASDRWGEDHRDAAAAHRRRSACYEKAERSARFRQLSIFGQARVSSSKTRALVPHPGPECGTGERSSYPSRSGAGPRGLLSRPRRATPVAPLTRWIEPARPRPGLYTLRRESLRSGPVPRMPSHPPPR